jgi:hypothetical protein
MTFREDIHECGKEYNRLYNRTMEFHRRLEGAMDLQIQVPHAASQQMAWTIGYYYRVVALRNFYFNHNQPTCLLMVEPYRNLNQWTTLYRPSASRHWTDLLLSAPSPEEAEKVLDLVRKRNDV